MDTIGLLFSFSGTVLIAFFISKDDKEWAEDEEGQKQGEKRYALFIKYPRWFYTGIVLVVTGFFD